MKLDKIIEQILKEESINFDDYSKAEKSIKKMVDTIINRYADDFPENYYGSVVDIYNTEYGKTCHITFLYNKPFKLDDIFDRSLPRFIKKDIEKLFSNYFPNISTSRSTIEMYKSHQNWYNKNK